MFLISGDTSLRLERMCSRDRVVRNEAIVLSFNVVCSFDKAVICTKICIKAIDYMEVYHEQSNTI